MAADPKRATAQIAAIVAAGFTPGDAARWVREAAAMVPAGADPRTWLPDPGTFAMSAVIDEAAVQDARADWYVVAPLEYKLLLDDLGPPQEAVGLGEAIFYNPYHEPAGTSVGGRFAHAEGTGAILRNGEGWYETEDVNAVPLYHRTTATALASIQREGLRSAQNTMYGEGIYFTNEAPQKSGARDAYVQATLHPHRQLVVERDIDVERIYREVADTRPWHSDSAEKLRAAGYGSVRLISSEGDWIWTLVIDPALIKLSPGVMLAEAKFGGPGSGNYGHGGRPGMVGGSAAGREATIGYNGEVLTDDALDPLTPQLSGIVADRAWLETNVMVEGDQRDALLDTLSQSAIPQRYFDGLAKITTAPPQGVKLGRSGKQFYDPSSIMGTDGYYVPRARTIHIAPGSVNSQTVMIHEVGHHVMYQKSADIVQRVADQLEYRRNGLPHFLNEVGLRQYSLEPGGHELYADALVVALRGSPSQQAALRKWLDMDWEALFIEAQFYDPNQPRVPAGNPAGGQWGGGVTYPTGDRQVIGKLGSEGVSVYSGALADADWCAANLQIDMPDGARATFLQALTDARIPQRFLIGCAFTTQAPPETQLHNGLFSPYKSGWGAKTKYDHANPIFGQWENGRVHISPKLLANQALLIHEVAHHAAALKKGSIAGERSRQAVESRLFQRKYEAEPPDLAALGLRSISFRSPDELLADAFVVGLRGTRAQQKNLRTWLNEDWEALFAEAQFYNPYHEPSGSPEGGRFAHASGIGTSLRSGDGWHEIEDVNAVPLYHATASTALESIQREGLRTANNTMYGEGVYFTNELPQKGGRASAYVQATLLPHRQLVIESDIDTARVYQEVAQTKPWYSDSAKKLRAVGYGSVRLISADGDWIWTLVLDSALIKLTSSVILSEAQMGGPKSGNYGHAGRPGVGVGGSGPGLSFAPTAERVWTGKSQPAAGDLSKETTGALGEALAAHVLSQRFGARFETLNQGLNNAPLDVAGDHVAVEVKTGLASNGASAQHWRATIGEPGREEKAAMRGLTAAEKAEYNQIKQELVMERKTDMLREMAAVIGGDVQGYTLGVILSPDGRRGDAWLIPGFHARIGWNQLARMHKDAYLGTWQIDWEAKP